MRFVAIALAAAALAMLPAQARASAQRTVPEQTKSETDTDRLNEGQAASTPSAESADAGTKKPTEQTAAESGVSTEPKPDPSAQASAGGRETLPSRS